MKKEKLLEKIKQYKDEHGAKALMIDIIEPALDGISDEEMELDSISDEEVEHDVSRRYEFGVTYARWMRGDDKVVIITDSIGDTFSVLLSHIVCLYKRCQLPDDMVKNKIMRATDRIIELYNEGSRISHPKLIVYGDRYDDDQQAN